MPRKTIEQRLRQLNLETRRAAMSFPDDFLTHEGKTDSSEVYDDKRCEEDKKASGYDIPSRIRYTRYESCEPRKIYEGWMRHHEDGFIQDVAFLLDEADWGDSLSLDSLSEPRELDDGDVRWEWAAPISYLGYRDGYVTVTWHSDSGFYDLELKHTSGMFVYGANYIVHGFEYEHEVMFYVNELRRHMLELKAKRDAEDEKRRAGNW